MAQDLDTTTTRKQRAEQTFTSLLAASPDALIIMDEGGRILLSSDQAAVLFGYTRSELEGQPIETLVPERLRPAHTNHRQTYSHDPRLRPMGANQALSARRKDGSELPVEISLNPWYDSDGMLVLAAIRDASERRRHEEELQRRGQWLRLLVQEIRDYAFLTLDANGAVTSWSRGAQAIKGWSADEIVGEHFSCFYPADQADAAAEALLVAAAEGRFEDEGWRVRKDGSRFWANVVITALNDETGELQGFAKVLRDMTDRKHAEDALREKEEWLRFAMEAGELGTFDWDAVADKSRVSDQLYRLLGRDPTDDPYSAAEWFARAIHPDDIEQAQEQLRQAMESPGQATNEYRVVWPDGSVHWVAAMSKVIERDDAGEALRMIGVMMDITQRRLNSDRLARQAAELRRSNADLEKFASIASHDLQEPLRTVSSYVQLIERRYADQLDDDAREFITYAVEGCARMHTLINDLLTYSRVGTRGRAFETTDCEQVITDVLADLRLTIEEGRVELTRDPLPVVQGDRGQLRQVFQNLIGNAIKFRRDEAPQIHISAEEQRGHWLFSVRDNGIGIAPEYYERIFVLFQRLHGRQDYSGTGIGLAVCKKIIERHGGSIWVEAEQNTGSTFFFTLPTSSQQREAA